MVLPLQHDLFFLGVKFFENFVNIELTMRNRKNLMYSFSRRTMRKKIEFDNSRARAYRKRMEVLAFRSDDPILFRKSWGEQNLRKDGWVIVPLTETRETTQDI